MSSSTTFPIDPQDFSAAQRGDRNAYSRLVTATQRMVTSVALAQVRDLQLSEDIAQETFLQAWQRIAQMRSAGSFLPWLREVARNRAIDYLRTMRYRESAAADLPELADQVHAAGPAEVLSHAQDAALLAQALDEIPAESREVLLLYYREAQSSELVASLLGLSNAAVRKRLQRARASLQAEMLVRVSGVVGNSVPGIGFTALVSGALGSASPASAGGLAAASFKSAPKLLVGSVGALFASIALVLGAVAIEMAIYFKRAKTPASRRALLRHGVVYGALMGSYILLLWHAARNNWALWQTLACGVLVSVAIVMLAIERGRIVATGRNGAE